MENLVVRWIESSIIQKKLVKFKPDIVYVLF